jgi:hypothetical protein
MGGRRATAAIAKPLAEEGEAAGNKAAAKVMAYQNINGNQ